MVEAEYQNILAQLRHEASHEDDPEAALAEIEAEADDYRRIAERRVRLGLLLSEIGAANGVEISEQEMNRLVDAGRLAISGQGPRDLHPLHPAGADGRRPAARAAVRGQGRRLPVRARPRSATARRPAPSSRPTSRARKAMSTARAAATTMRMRPPKAKKARQGQGARSKAAAKDELVRPSPPRVPVEKASAKPKPAKPVKDAPAAKAARQPRLLRSRRKEGASEEAGQEGLSEREIVCEDLNLAIDDLQAPGLPARRHLSGGRSARRAPEPGMTSACG